MNQFENAVVTARKLIESFIKQNGEIGFPIMVIPPHLMSTREPVPIEQGILYEITRLYNVPLIWQRVDVSKTSHIRAMYWRTSDEAWGIVPAFHNQCWSRFLLCKELIHVALDSNNNKTSGAEKSRELIDSLLSGMPDFLSEAVAIDHVAKIAAMELILPKEFQNDIRDMFEQGCSHKDVAESFLVPEDIIKMRYETGTKAFFEKVYKDYS